MNSGFETPTASSTLSWAGENRLAAVRSATENNKAVNDNAANDRAAPGTTYFLVRDSAGRPEYLLSGSRALQRKP